MFSKKCFIDSLKLFIIDKFNRKMFLCEQGSFSTLMLCKSSIYVVCATNIILTI